MMIEDAQNEEELDDQEVPQRKSRYFKERY